MGFLVALKSYRRRFVGLLARALQAIPVARPQDDARRAKGMLCVSPDDPCILLSIQGGPTFLEESIRPKDSLAISGVEGEPVSVTEMLDADRVRVSRPVKFTGEGATTSSAYKIMPYIDQAGVYDAVYERLSAGECIGIFPEGGSHDRAEMLPLKAGVTLMVMWWCFPIVFQVKSISLYISLHPQALGAMARNPSLDVKIVPCGLSYFNPDRFRSRAVIEFGKALTIDPSLVTRFKEGGAAKR